MTVAAPVQKVDTAAWQQTLDYLLPRVSTLRADQIASAVGIDKRTVDRAFEGPATNSEGKVVRPWLLGFAINAGRGERFTRRIPRDCAVLWLAHCANHSPEDKLNAIAEATEALCARDLLILQQRIAANLRRKA